MICLAKNTKNDIYKPDLKPFIIFLNRLFMAKKAGNPSLIWVAGVGVNIITILSEYQEVLLKKLQIRELSRPFPV
jgi:hypothetical protein